MFKKTQENIFNKSSNYGILPPEIRYNKDLSHLDKILFGEITAQSKDTGYCDGTDNDFALLYYKTVSTFNELLIQKSIKRLSEMGYIFTMKEGENRRIYLNDVKEWKEPNIGIKDIEETNDDIHNLPNKYGKNYVTRLIEIYHIVWNQHFKSPCNLTVNGKNGAILKKLKKDYTEYEIACMIMIHFEWRGLNGNDEFIYRKLFNNGFPLSWIPNSAELYKTFIMKYLDLKNNKEIKQWVDNTIEICKFK